MPYIPCIDSQAEAIVGKVLLIVETELNSRDETCEAGQFEQTRPEADGKKILAWGEYTPHQPPGATCSERPLEHASSGIE